MSKPWLSPKRSFFYISNKILLINNTDYKGRLRRKFAVVVVNFVSVFTRVCQILKPSPHSGLRAQYAMNDLCMGTPHAAELPFFHTFVFSKQSLLMSNKSHLPQLQFPFWLIPSLCTSFAKPIRLFSCLSTISSSAAAYHHISNVSTLFWTTG